MTLKDTISKWHRSICLLEDRPEEAIKMMEAIQNPSAKIIYNIGCISMKLGARKDAIEYFTSSVEKDKYLAISYFQRGVCHYKMKNYILAERDFNLAKSMVPEDGIDYRQLGAEVILKTDMIEGYTRSCRHSTHSNMPSPVQYSFMNFIFHPPKKMVANLKKEDFLGKAKVISSVQEADILYAEEKIQQDIFRKHNLLNAGRSVSTFNLSLSPGSKSPQMSRHSSGAARKTTPPPFRPPPRLGRSRSVGDLLEDNCEEDELLPSGASVMLPKNEDHFQKRQSFDEVGYTKSSLNRSDSIHEYERLSLSHLSASASALDRPKKRPPVPKRPVMKAKGDDSPQTKSQLLSQGLEFQKVQKALQKKFGDCGQNKDNEMSMSQTTRDLTEKQQPSKLGGSNDQQALDMKRPLKAVMAFAPTNLSHLLAQTNNKPSAAVNSNQILRRKENSGQVGLMNLPQVQVNGESLDQLPKPVKPARPPPPKARK